MSLEPPRLNGELVFEAPWHARAFGLVMALVDSGALSYAQFQEHLVVQVPLHDGYYDAWLAALEDACAVRALVLPAEVSARAEATVAARVPDHAH